MGIPVLFPVSPPNPAPSPGPPPTVLLNPRWREEAPPAPQAVQRGPGWGSEVLTEPFPHDGWPAGWSRSSNLLPIWTDALPTIQLVRATNHSVQSDQGGGGGGGVWRQEAGTVAPRGTWSGERGHGVGVLMVGGLAASWHLIPPSLPSASSATP